MNKNKICIKCGETKPATTEYFYKHKQSKDGLLGKCKICISLYGKTKYKNNPKSLQEKTKIWRDKNKNRQYTNNKSWANRNKDKLFLYYKKYRDNNKQKILESKKTWRKNNPEKVNIIIQRRLARKKDLQNTFTSEQWKMCKNYFGNKCCYCGKNKKLEQEHFIALSKGGEYTHNNIIPACRNCNPSKGDKDFFIWYPEFKYYSKERKNKILEYLNYKKDIQLLALF